MADPTVTPPAVDTGNPALNSLIHRGLLIATAAITAWVTAWLTAKGWYDPNFGWLITVAVFGALSSVALVVWGYIRGTRLAGFINEVQRTAVQAGINLTASGNAITTTGASIVAHGTGDGTQIPLPVTSGEAKAIVKNFATPVVVLAKAPGLPAG